MFKELLTAAFAMNAECHEETHFQNWFVIKGNCRPLVALGRGHRTTLAIVSPFNFRTS